MSKPLSSNGAECFLQQQCVIVHSVLRRKIPVRSWIFGVEQGNDIDKSLPCLLKIVRVGFIVAKCGFVIDFDRLTPSCESKSKHAEF